MSKQKCAYKGCKTIYGITGKSFFRFPNNDDRSLHWILHSGNEELLELPLIKLREKRICSAHFSNKAFTNELKNKLVHNACPIMYEIEKNASSVSTAGIKINEDGPSPEIPTVKVGGDIIDSKDRKASAQIPSVEITSANNATDVKNNFNKSTTPVTSKNSTDTHAATYSIRNKRKLRNLKLKPKQRNSLHANESEKNLFDQIDKRVTGAPRIFVKMQLRGRKKVKKWAKEEKELGLAMFYRSPKLYEAMSKMGFRLPSVRCIREWVNSSNIKPDVATLNGTAR